MTRRRGRRRVGRWIQYPSKFLEHLFRLGLNLLLPLILRHALGRGDLPGMGVLRMGICSLIGSVLGHYHISMFIRVCIVAIGVPGLFLMHYKALMRNVECIS